MLAEYSIVEQEVKSMIEEELKNKNNNKEKVDSKEDIVTIKDIYNNIKNIFNSDRLQYLHDMEMIHSQKVNTKKKIKLLVLDVDGTLTNGNIIYTENGSESKKFCVKDGMAITLLKKLNIKVAVITGRNSKLVEKRLKGDLKVDYLFQDIKDKKSVVEQILVKEGLTWENVASCGDDFNDCKMLENSYISGCPNNVDEEISNICDFISTKNGGDGAVREFIKHILEHNGEPSLKDLYFMKDNSNTQQ